MKSSSPTHPKIFCIEKSNVIVLPSLRNEVGEHFEEIKISDENNSFKDNKFDRTNSALLNENCSEVDKSLVLRNFTDCVNDIEAQKEKKESLNILNINEIVRHGNRNKLGRIF